MTIPPPIPEETRARIVELAAAGVSRNAIAAEVGVARRTVTKYATAAGHTFDRTATKAATEAARIDNAAKREALAADILTEVAVSIRGIREAPLPANARESEQRTRALANASRAFGVTTRAAPTPTTDPHAEAREAIRAFREQLRDRSELLAQLEAYETRYGALDETSIGRGLTDNYGREGLDGPEHNDERP